MRPLLSAGLEAAEQVVAGLRSRYDEEAYARRVCGALRAIGHLVEEAAAKGEAAKGEAAKLSQWVLTYIEFIGNFVILAFLLTFISIYWCIGNWNIKLL